MEHSKLQFGLKIIFGVAAVVLLGYLLLALFLTYILTGGVGAF